MKKKIVPLILLVVAVAGTTTYYYVNKYRNLQPETTLKISGNIEAHESVVGFKVQGRLTELPIEEGQLVKAGDLIAKLDQSDYRQQVGIDEATVNNREAELKLSLSGNRIQEKKSAEQSVVEAKATLVLNQADFTRYQALYEKDEVSAQIRDIYAANLKRAQATYERAKQNYDMVMEGVRKEQIAINRASIRTARQSLELSKIRLGYTSLLAPTAGVALVRHAEVGEVMAPGTPVVTIADLDHLWLRGYISETDIAKVKLGQPATVICDTYPGKHYKGRVSFISSQAEFTPKSVETFKERVTLVYRIKIDLDNLNHELKPGMPADASIETIAAK
ncbi:MAG: efflux RND transporter periplasmic adaptor subunit [Pedobacter sp.]